MKTSLGSNSLILLAVFALVLFAGAQTAQAAWSEPVSITGLNDPNWHGGKYPCISSDQRTVFFMVNRPSTGSITLWDIVEARREDPSGPFTSERALTELNPDGVFTVHPWISLDGQRLYYAQTIKEGGGWGSRVIKMAVRDGDSAWLPAKTLWEIHQTDTADTEETLSGDELTILWARKGLSSTSPLRYLQATRASIDEPFSDIREVPELSALLNATGPHLSPAGLRVYINIENAGDNGASIYVGSRASLDDPFDNFQLLEGVTGPGMSGRYAHLTPDERTIYFNSRRGGVGGIWVSHLILSPRIVAIESLEEAIEEKRAAIGRITAAIRQEVKALQALQKISMKSDSDRLSRSDIYKSRTQIMLALRRQIKARSELQKAIDNLREAIGHLRPDRPHPPEPGTGNHPGNGNKPDTSNKPQTDRPRRTGSSRR
ncbi:MAG: DUF4200 domain-containing protein [Planctomycetes bacterium]|nr:DUF4200 domain-containing protein [Planctomycetota bacterium]